MLKLKYMFENFELAKQALRDYEHDTERLDESLSWFRISANAVYPFFCGGELCFLRLAPVEEKDFRDIQGEIEFIRYLRSCGYPAMEPIPAKGGAYCFSLDTRWGGFYACAFRRVSGKPLEDVEMDDGVLYEYGAALGWLHGLSQNFVPAVKKRSYADVLESLRDEFAAEDVPETVRRELGAVSGLLNLLPRTAENFGLVHYDFEPDNVFWNAAEHRCAVIDFDDGMYHWYALDVEQVFDCLTEFFEGDALQRAKEQFLKGYRSHRAFSEEMEGSLPLMRRFVDLYSYARLRHCLSEPVQEKPDWMKHLEKRLRSRMDQLEKTFAHRSRMKLERITNQTIDLDSFDRTQEVGRVYVNENGKCFLKDRVWTMDWSLERKREVAADLRSDENISYAAYDGGRIVGFVSVLKKPVGCRMVLDMIQVDRSFRGQGIGRQLFELAVAEAKKAGAKELYISACCSEETVNFYKAMGAVVTDDPIPEIAQAEPYDIQMTCGV